jgi:hypothetical protein
MKKILLSLSFVLSLTAGFSQSDKYMKAMQDRVPAVDSIRSTDDLLALSAAFERIADAEKTQWLPYYYAALTQVNAAYGLANVGQNGVHGGLAQKIDPLADKAEALITKADALNKDNSEIYVVRKMIASIRMIADPMTRYMTYGPQAQQALETAQKLNPDNPRVYLLQAEDKYFTPEQFGGSKEEGMKLFQEAIKKYDAWKSPTPIDPNWGRNTAQYFLSQAK